MNLDEFINSIAIPLYGVSAKIDYFNMRESLDIYNKKNPIEFCSSQLEDRLRAGSVLRDVKSVITILMPYELENKINITSGLKVSTIVSNNAWEVDYHRQLKNKLEKIAFFLNGKFDNVEYKCVVDTSPLIDRRMAFESGVGCYGKNTFLINDELGTSFYIGSLLIDKDLDELLKASLISQERINKSKKNYGLFEVCNKCKDCDLCVKYCPGNALNGDYTISSNKCISYLTQKKDILTYDERKLISNRLYGCDICQKICPYNKISFNLENEYKRKTSNLLDAVEIVKMSNKKLKKEYLDSGFIWRGPKIIKRNAIVNIGNSKSFLGRDFLIDFYFELSIELRTYALWAIFNIDYNSFLKFKEKNVLKFSEEEKLEVLNLLSENN